MTTIERVAAIVASNRILKEESGEEPNMLIFEIATLATAAVWTAGAAGNVTCLKAIVAIEKLLKESKK